MLFCFDHIYSFKYINFDIINKLDKIAGLTKKHKSFKIGPLNVALGVFIGIIIAAVVVFIVIVGVICFLIVLCIRHKTKKAQSTEQGNLVLHSQ